MNDDLEVSTEWSSEVPFPEIDKDLVYLNIEKVLKYLSPGFLSSLELQLFLVDDHTIETINWERRGIKKTTDVLSFPLYSEFPQIPIQILGEVIISVNTCRKQATEIGHSVVDEFYRLLIHGILHLFGYDHETSEDDAVAMRRKEDECLDIVFES
ncbi:rRNA maturation RNase YbeY [Leptospira sp. 96542]|nr:rRNA maturation RNase YbeY [Leptospira sp. 96542]